MKMDADEKELLDSVERGEWKSYRIHYVHPIETGDLTAYLTAIGNERYLDVMPSRGEDRGSRTRAIERRDAGAARVDRARAPMPGCDRRTPA